jgi:hypothetical protein
MSASFVLKVFQLLEVLVQVATLPTANNAQQKIYVRTAIQVSPS